jgi:branched-chain amino acid transport system ATP-binding protein
MLEVQDLHAYYGKSHILEGVDMYVDAGEVVSLLGRNGVGRSTTVKAIMGEVPPQGSIKFKDYDIAGLPSYRIARLGLGYVPENRDIFPGLTVRQNLILGIKDPRHPGKWRLDDMLRMFPNLAERADTAAGVLSSGEQQMLTICRTLMGDPELVMIDEPTEGLAPIIVQQVGSAGRRPDRRHCPARRRDPAGRTEAVDRHADIAPCLCDGPWTDRIRWHTSRTQCRPRCPPRMARSLMAARIP